MKTNNYNGFLPFDICMGGDVITNKILKGKQNFVRQVKGENYPEAICPVVYIGT